MGVDYKIVIKLGTTGSTEIRTVEKKVLGKDKADAFEQALGYAGTLKEQLFPPPDELGINNIYFVSLKIEEDREAVCRCGCGGSGCGVKF